MSDFDYLMDAMYSYSTNQILWSLLLLSLIHIYTELEKAEEIFMQGYNTTNDILERLLIDKGSIWKE